MQYEVIRYFTDAQDNEHAYHEGDIYPRDGLNVSEQRIKNLMSGNNFQGIGLIKPIKGKPGRKPKVEKTETKTELSAEDIQKMPFMKLKSVAKQNGIEVDDKEASDIRADLIKKLGL